MLSYCSHIHGTLFQLANNTFFLALKTQHNHPMADTGTTRDKENTFHCILWHLCCSSWTCRWKMPARWEQWTLLALKEHQQSYWMIWRPSTHLSCNLPGCVIYESAWKKRTRNENEEKKLNCDAQFGRLLNKILIDYGRNKGVIISIQFLPCGCQNRWIIHATEG